MGSDIVRREVKVVGVTFANDDGTNRQEILRELDYQHCGDLSLADLELKEYQYMGAPAYHVVVDDQIVGNLPASLSAELKSLERAQSYSFWIKSAQIVGGSQDDDDDHSLKYGLRLVLCLASPDAIKAEAEKIKQRQQAKAAVSDMKFCQHCGAKVFKEAVMCPSCKKSLVAYYPRASSKKKTARKKKPGAWKLVLSIYFLLSAIQALPVSYAVVVLDVAIASGFFTWWVYSRKTSRNPAEHTKTLDEITSPSIDDAPNKNAEDSASKGHGGGS